MCTGTQKGGDICRALIPSPQPQHTLLLPGHCCGLCWVSPRTAGSARIPSDGPACPSQQPASPWPFHPLCPHPPASSSPWLAWQPPPLTNRQPSVPSVHQYTRFPPPSMARPEQKDVCPSWQKLQKPPQGSRHAFPCREDGGHVRGDGAPWAWGEQGPTDRVSKHLMELLAAAAQTGSPWLGAHHLASVDGPRHLPHPGPLGHQPQAADQSTLRIFSPIASHFLLLLPMPQFQNLQSGPNSNHPPPHNS